MCVTANGHHCGLEMIVQIIRLALATSVLMPAIAAVAAEPADEGVQKKQPPSPLKVGEPVSLFDGKTLNGWTTQSGKPVERGWTVDDGSICRESRGGNIFYEREVGDF
ncbi:MAG: family 16 glycoside hydrolase, partial [Pirellulales bacterium]